MQIGISSASFFLKAQTEDCFDIFRSINCEVSEVFLNTFSEYEDEFTQLLQLRQGNVQVHSIHTLNNHFEPELFNPSERTRTDAENIFTKVLRGGRRLGAKYYTFHGPARLKSRPYNIDYKSFGERCTQINDICNQHDITLSYENVHWTFYNFAGFFTNLRKYAPQLKATLDIKQAMQSGECVYKYIEDMGNCISTVHVCDYDDSGNLRLPGKGMFDFVKLFSKLREIGYNNPIIMEVYSGNYEKLEEIMHSYEFLQECLYKSN